MDARNACRVLGIDLVTLYSSLPSLPSLPSLAPSAFMYRALLVLVVVGILLAEGDDTNAEVVAAKHPVHSSMQRQRL